jgi:hypothetical protein
MPGFPAQTAETPINRGKARRYKVKSADLEIGVPRTQEKRTDPPGRKHRDAKSAQRERKLLDAEISLLSLGESY